MQRVFRSLQVKTLMAMLLLVGSLAPTVSAAPTALLTDGKTTVTLSNDFLGALVALRLSAGTVGEGTLRSGVASFPVTGGALDLATAKGEINHTGGLVLAAGSTRVELLSFNIDTSGSRTVLTGLVTVNGDFVGRLPLFDLTLPAVTLPLQPQAFNNLFLPGVKVALSAEAAQALNTVFGVTAFTEGFNIGTASLFAVTTNSRRNPFAN
ncbi:MAG: hypothetical protein SF097_06695 [Acidobacteriota bacterium]|nr:hypothetical protein [Acidobacteriota bacterium]